MKTLKTFLVTIEEVCTQDFEIEAEDAGEALAIAEKKYRNHEIVLEPGELQFRQMAVSSPDNESTEWIEF